MKKVLFINIALLFILIYVCISYNHRQAIVNTERPIVKIYYDKENDKLFERNELTIRYIVFYSIIYLCSFIWLYIIIKKNYKKISTKQI